MGAVRAQGSLGSPATLGLFGILAATLAGGGAGHTLYGQTLPSDMALGLTDRRVPVLSVNFLTTRPTRVVGSVPPADLLGADAISRAESRRISAPLTLRFADHSELTLDAPPRLGS